VLDATNAFSLVIEEQKRLSGIPADDLQAAREAADKDEKQAVGKPRWKFTLHMPSYLPVMQYADDRSLRERLYRESATRASEFGRPDWDNTALIARIVELRRELAALLGYASYAEVSLEPKMAHSPAEVLGFGPLPDPNWESRSWRRGMSRTRRKSCASSATPSRTRK
jgi:oligopeptidase A